MSSLPAGSEDKLSTAGYLCHGLFLKEPNQDGLKPSLIAGLHIEQTFSEPPLCTKPMCYTQRTLSHSRPQAMPETEVDLGRLLNYKLHDCAHHLPLSKRKGEGMGLKSLLPLSS
jgi:hypothetical protein